MGGSAGADLLTCGHPPAAEPGEPVRTPVVEDGGGQDVVGEDLAPFAEGLVAGDDDRSFLVAAGDDLEGQGGGVPGGGGGTDFIHDQGGAAPGAAELAGRGRRGARRPALC